MAAFTAIAFLLSILALTGVIVYASLIYVKPDEYLMVNWKFPLSPRPPVDQYMALGLEQGWRARIYLNGYNWILMARAVCDFDRRPLTLIEGGQFATVEALFGVPLSPGELFARRVIRANNFTDGEQFLRQSGQRGVQIPLVLQGKWAINERMFKVRIHSLREIKAVQAEVEVAIGKPTRTMMQPHIGIVTLMVGEEIPETERRTIARRMENHSNFQQLANLLGDHILSENRLEMGIQPDVVEMGKFAHHPFIVGVEDRPMRYIRQGSVAVVFSSAGKDPTDDQIEEKVINNRGEVAVILKKVQGIAIVEIRGYLKETFGPGFIPVHFYHPYAYNLVIIDTAPTRICWVRPGDHQQQQPGQAPAHTHALSTVEFGPILVNTKEGFAVPMDAELLTSFSRENAPWVAAYAGSGEAMIRDVLKPVFEDIAQRVISTKSINELIESRDAIREETETAVREVFNKPFHTDVERFNILRFDFEHSPDPQTVAYVNLKTQQASAARQVEVYAAQAKAEEARVAVEMQKSTADSQVVLIGAQFAEKAAEHERNRIKTRGEGVADVAERLQPRGTVVQALGILAADPEILANIARALSRGGPPRT